MRQVFGVIFLFLASNGVYSQNIDNPDNFWSFLVDALKFLLSQIDFDPDTDLTIEQFTAKYNYTLEAYNVTTEDHHILTVHRIPLGRNLSEEEKFKKRPVVFLAHGMIASAMDWIWQGPNQSLALLLADEALPSYTSGSCDTDTLPNFFDAVDIIFHNCQFHWKELLLLKTVSDFTVSDSNLHSFTVLGYDVWLFNGRGNRYSMGHETLTPENSSYWDYSFHERGIYDLPATIDFVLKITNVEKITYIGHSEGTTNMMVLASSKPQYNEYMNLVVFLAPVAYTQHISSPVVQLIADNLSTAQTALNVFGFHGLSYHHELSMILYLMCNSQSSLQSVCSLVLESILGFNVVEVDMNKLPVYLSNAPAGVSVKEIVHYIQDMKSGYFRQYDYGTIANLLHYGSTTPPSYEIGKLTAPLGLYYAENDFLSNIKDVENYISKLSQDTVFRKVIDDPYFNHLNFLFCTEIKPLIYDSLIELVQKFNPLSGDVVIP